MMLNLICAILPKYILGISTIFDKMKKKSILCFAICFLCSICASFAQISSDTFINKKPDTLQNKRLLLRKAIKDTSSRAPAASTVNEGKRINFILPDSNPSKAVTPAPHRFSPLENKSDTFQKSIDSLADSNKMLAPSVAKLDSSLLAKNKYINSSSKAVALPEYPHKASGKEFLFYILCLVLLILGLFRTFFTGYFKNLFRVYFNTSLRQTQLSDQLRQATLPSLILNIFFAITAGIYIWLLFSFYHPPKLFKVPVLLPFCILSVATIYFIKFCLLKFLGWVSDVQESTNGYIFAIFLVNKMTGIFLVPLIIVLAFINPEWLPAVLNISFLLLILLFLSRYVKSYGIIEKKIPLRPFHFFIYIAGAEIIPLLILYKVAIDYLI